MDWRTWPTEQAAVVEVFALAAGDDWPYTWWDRDDEAAGVAELQAWPARHASVRLRACGEDDLAVRAELVMLPYEERWNHPYRVGDRRAGGAASPAHPPVVRVPVRPTSGAAHAGRTPAPAG
ncbi:hypothetical protein ACWDFL_26140 [Streptomyces bungoensis]